MRSHLRICGKLKCGTCGKIYKGTQGLERHLAIKQGYHCPTPEAEEILRHIRRKSQFQNSENIPESRKSRVGKRTILPKPTETFTVSTQTEKMDQSVQVDNSSPIYTACNNNPDIRTCGTQIQHTETMWEGMVLLLRIISPNVEIIFKIFTKFFC